MTTAFEKPRIVSGLAVMAISQIQIAPRQVGRGLVFAAAKTPAALVFRKGQRISAVTMDGEVLKSSELERRFPGAVDKIATPKKRPRKKR